MCGSSKIVWFNGKITLFSWPGKTDVNLDLEYPKPLQHCLLYDSLNLYLPLGLSGAVNTAEQEDQCLNYLTKQKHTRMDIMTKRLHIGQLSEKLWVK